MSLMIALVVQALPTVEQLENQTPWTVADREVATAVAKAHSDRWRACVATARAKLAKSREPAETIATAVLGSCLAEQKAAHRAITIAFRGLLEPSARITQADAVIASWRSDVREEVIAAVLSGR